MIKVLALTRYSRLGASSRLRFYQYEPWLRARGINLTIAPLFLDAYVQGLQKNIKNPFQVLKSYVTRVQDLVSSRKFDIVWVEKETLPWLPAFVEKILMRGNIPFVLDYDDAVFHYYDQHENAIVKTLLKNKHPKLMQSAALVIAGNSYLAEFARLAGSTNVEIIPTVINIDSYPAVIYKREVNDLPCVGWIGQLSTASFLLPHASLFQKLSSEKLARFVAIGIDTKALGLPMTSIPWNEVTEVASIARFDIGIMPLNAGHFERGKCGYKLIQYMACSLPVVASPVGVNLEIIEHGVNGFLAETKAEWDQALRTLLADPALRFRMGQAGRKKVIEKYCIQKTESTLAQLLFDSAKK
jgi:hypothetical protein